MNGLAMLYLAHALRRAGFAAECFDYHSMRGELSEHVSALSDRVAGTVADTVHIVAHSFGGIVALHYLHDARDDRLGRLVMLGTPAGGSQAARAFADWPAGKLMLGRSIDVWRSEDRAPLDPRSRVGAIAGSRAFGLGSVFMNVPGPCDGVVTVAETLMPGLADHLVLPVSHSGMLISRQAARQTVAFLRNGYFGR
jgi:pimeloyl-ACP methyl ester carboxylesterase